jgi:DNA-binding transcriptional MocR family regulator
VAGVQHVDNVETLETIASAVPVATAEGIANTIEVLVARGALSAGFRLPTVRQLARRLEVSPTTVATAWRSLFSTGLIETRGRAGTFVADARSPLPRPWLSGTPGRYVVDLSTGTPDPALLPDLGAALVEVAGGPPDTRTYLGPVVLTELEAAIRERLGFSPAALTVVDGAIDAMDRVMAQVVRRGVAVLVENPCFPPIAELARVHGGRVVPIDIDDRGPRLDALEEASSPGPSVIVYQPRANNPAGVSLDAERLEALGDFVSRHPDAICIEDDSAGDLSVSPEMTLSVRFPERVVHIRSYSKSHGPDLRLAALTGPATIVDAVVDRRRLGPVWSPRILQRALHHMLTSEAVERQLGEARRRYGERRAMLREAFAAEGVQVSATDGINLWVPVTDERDAMVTLASLGIGVAPGRPFQLRPGAPHVRVTVSADLPAGTARQLATVAAGRFSKPRSLV